MKLPPSTTTNSSDTQRAAAFARYMAVQHLSDRAAAAILGISFGSVRSYRSQYPAIRPKEWTERRSRGLSVQALAQVQRASGGAKKRSYVFEASGGRFNRVSVLDDTGVRE